MLLNCDRLVADCCCLVGMGLRQLNGCEFILLFATGDVYYDVFPDYVLLFILNYFGLAWTFDLLDLPFGGNRRTDILNHIFSLNSVSLLSILDHIEIILISSTIDNFLRSQITSLLRVGRSIMHLSTQPIINILTTSVEIITTTTIIDGIPLYNICFCHHHFLS